MTRINRAASTSPYTVRMSQTAEKGLRGLLPEREADAAVSFIWNELRWDPTEYGDYGRALHGKLTGRLAARQRRFRIIYRLDEGSRTIEILEIQRR